MLINVEETYNLAKLDEEATAFIKKKFKQLPDQSEEEFFKELKDEILLEKAHRCRVMAEKWEREALGEQIQTIRLVYSQNGNLTIKDD